MCLFIPLLTFTYVLDEFITRSLCEHHLDTVLNLAAGLDTRPYRLPLPKSLRWIEVDLPDIFRYKREKLATLAPACSLESVALDLTDEQKRGELFNRVNAEARSVLIVTEGLLNCLPGQQVRSLASELSAYEHMRWWCTDMASPLMLRLLQLLRERSLRSGKAQFQLATAHAAQFFSTCGRLIEQRAYPSRCPRSTSGSQLGKALPLALPPSRRNVSTDLSLRRHPPAQKQIGWPAIFSRRVLE